MGASKVVATNRKARHDYYLEEIFEAGLVLNGTEVKSIRAGRLSLRESYATVEGGEVFLHNMHISPYTHGNRWNHDPVRVRKLLLTKTEIRRLIGKVKQQGLTLVPLKVYINERGWTKIEIAVARGKRLWDKRKQTADRDAEREAARAQKERLRV